MTLVLPATSSPPAEFLDRPSAAIMSRGRHVGMLYRLDNEDVKLIHLAGHNELRTDTEWDEDLHWAHLADLEPEDIDSLSAYLELVAKLNPETPYGLSDHGVSFDRDTGTLVRDREAAGLTCATFILAVLKAQQFEPVLKDGWPVGREDDRKFQKVIVDYFRKNDDYERANAVEADVGCARFTPKEVTGCCVEPSWPHSWKVAEKLAQQVANDMGD